MSLGRMISRMAHEIVEKTPECERADVIGIRSRVFILARRIARKIEEIGKFAPPVGSLDVSSYRDDRAGQQRAGNAAFLEVPFAVDEKTWCSRRRESFRGRTIRAAMEAVARLDNRSDSASVLVDRGARELPIRADVVGKKRRCREGQRVNVLLIESDGIDQVTVGRCKAAVRFSVFR